MREAVLDWKARTRPPSQALISRALFIENDMITWIKSMHFIFLTHKDIPSYTQPLKSESLVFFLPNQLTYKEERK